MNTATAQKIADLISEARTATTRGKRKQADAALRDAHSTALTLAHISRLVEAGLLK
jgi:hypothetical protein